MTTLTRERMAQVAVGLLGLALVGVGVIATLDAVPIVTWPRIALWLAFLVGIHDALIAPAAVLIGYVVLRRVKHPVVQRLLRPALLLAVAAAVVAVPLLETGGLR